MHAPGWVLLTVAFLLGPAVATSTAAAVDPVTMIVGFYEFPSEVSPGAPLLGGRVVGSVPGLGFVLVEAASVDTVVAAAVSDPRVRYVEEDTVRQWVRFTPNDPSFRSQYGPQLVRAPEAWDVTRGTVLRVVCVVDSGLRATHEEFLGPRYQGGYDFVGKDADPADDHGHGTHVAGIAAGALHNGKGIAGLGNLGLRVAKVLDAEGRSPTSRVAEGIHWCVQNGAHVINLSLGGEGNSPTLRIAVEAAAAANVLVVASAGNDGPCPGGCVGYPARYSAAMAVGCVTATKALCWFSSTGIHVEVAAPGESILSAYHSGDASYARMSGTSMSAPHVAGAAALLWSYVPTLTAGQVREVLRDTAQDLGAAGCDVGFGHGLLDVKAALDAAALSPLTSDVAAPRAVAPSLAYTDNACFPGVGPDLLGVVG
ncbi:MAG TPA: S8 family serine peptidase [Candidatus Thermoplasmatota archaeon]|nr:S8 family serine peptidase [Candidatus Thermoplasmatota archaeon]